MYNYEFWADGIEKLLSWNNVIELLLERNEIHNTFYDAYINQDISYIYEDYSDKFIENSAMDSIYYRITSMIDKGCINEAENIMYEMLNPKIKQEYYTMLCIYDYMNDLDEKFLIEHGFSKDEVEDGIKEITALHDESVCWMDIV